MSKHLHLGRLVCSFTLLATVVIAAPRKSSLSGTYIATAYSVTGITSSGEWTHRHVIAADPDILPIGTRIKVQRAGKYSGEYVVADTGSKIVGRKLDIYLPSTAECKKFGKKPVRVTLIELGEGTHADAKAADAAVKKDVDKDIAKGRVGNAATQQDWAGKPASAKAAIVNAAAQAKPAPAGQTTATDTSLAPTPK